MTLDAVLHDLSARTAERGSEMSVATMTILVFFEDASIGELARNRIHALAGKHPSRVILLDATQGEELARVDSSDWIELGVKDVSAAAIGSMAGVLRIPDVPLVLLWIAPGIGDDDRFCALAPEASTIVYNSSLVDVGTGALCRLVAYVHEHPQLPLADIAYLRLAPWQESVATLFDGNSGALLKISAVEIGCGSDPEAVYLLGWLASRLGWKARSERTLLSQSGGEITFAMAREGEPRRIRRVTLRAAGSTFEAEVDADGATIHLSITGSLKHAPRYRAVQDPGIAALVERAILEGRNDRVFADSLAAAGEFLACGDRAS